MYFGGYTIDVITSSWSRAIIVCEDCYFKIIHTRKSKVGGRYRRTERFGRSRSCKVIDFGTNRKLVCAFLLLHHSNLGPILHCFGAIAGFLYSGVTPPLFHPTFAGCSRCIRSPMLGSSYSAVKLFSKNANLCDHSTWTSRTDQESDGRHTVA